MGRELKHKSGQTFLISNQNLQAAIDSGEYEIPDDLKTVVVEEGHAVETATPGRFLSRGAHVETSDEFRRREDLARRANAHDNLGSELLTAAETGLDTLSLGGYGAAADAIMGDEYATNRRERAEENSSVALAAEIGSVLLPTGAAALGGRAAKAIGSTPLGMAERLGTKIAKSGQGGSLGKALSRNALGYGAEGAIIGTGEGIQELVASGDPLTVERALGTIGSGALYGGLLGGGVGAAGKALEKGLDRGRKMLQESAEKAKAGGVSDDLASLDEAGLRARERDIRKSTGEQFVVDAKEFYDNGSVYRAAADASDKAVVTKTREWVRKRLDDPKGLAKSPNGIASSLRKEEVVLRRIAADQEGVLKKFAQQEDELLERLGREISDFKAPVELKGEDAALYGHVIGRGIKGKGAGKGAKLDKADLEEFRALLESGAGKRARAEAVADIPAQLEKNLKLQNVVDGLGDRTLPDLMAIDTAMDALKGAGKKAKAGALEQIAQGTIFGAVTTLASPLGIAAPFIGAKVAGVLTDLVFGRLGKAATDASARTAKVVDRFLDASKRVAPAAPPLASKTLTSVAFGAQPSSIANQLAKKPKQGLAEAYRAREEELRKVTYQAPDGSTQMRPGPRAEVARRLEPVRAVSPLTADRLETVAARRVAFLASKLPRRPGGPALELGPDDWRPSDFAIRTFARYVAAVEDPGSVEERLLDGTVTAEDAEAIRTVYPTMYEDIKAQIVARLPELRQKLPFERRLALSLFSGVPVDAAMEPDVLAMLQQGYAEEPGTDGGIQPPKPSPQFGSVSRPDPTAAQERAG